MACEQAGVTVYLPKPNDLGPSRERPLWQVVAGDDIYLCPRRAAIYPTTELRAVPTNTSRSSRH